MLPHPNLDHPEPAYHCGRLLAVLVDLERKALGAEGDGVVQGHYAEASYKPAAVLGRLTALSKGHLTGLESGQARWYESRIAQIWSKIDRRMPSTLPFEGRTLFALGYCQEKEAVRKMQS